MTTQKPLSANDNLSQTEQAIKQTTKQTHVDFFGDWFPIPIAILASLGLLIVYSASLSSKPNDLDQLYLFKHLIFLVLGGFAGWGASLLKSQQWIRLAPWLYLGVLLLLVGTWLPGLGVEVKGSRRWVRLAGVSLQPSELAKVVMPLLLCSILISNMRGKFFIAIAAACPALFLVITEPDLGTTLFLVGGVGLITFLTGTKLRYFFVATLIVIPAAVCAAMWNPYQWKRVTGFMTALTDLSKAPYQLKQSLVSLGSGGVSGVGLGHGTQKLSFLPEANNDFIFSVVGEELGLVGTLGVIGLWGVLYILGWIRLNRIRDSRVSYNRFAYPVAFTLLTQIIVQAYLNIAVVVAIVPPKGISHPLLSSGGSGLLATFIALGIVYGLTESSEEESEVDFSTGTLTRDSDSAE